MGATLKKYHIFFHGDNGPKKVGTEAAESDKAALRQFFANTGADQISVIRHRFKAKLAEAQENRSS